MSHTDGARRSRQEIPQVIEARTRARIDHAVGRARLVLLWERLWPRIAPLGVVAAAFLSLSWFGVWQMVPESLRIAGLVLFAIAAVALVFRLVRIELPSHSAALARVERASGVAHRPATAYSDRLAATAHDPASQTLWQAHRRRLLAALDRLRAGQPQPGLAARDPYALRFLAVLVLIVAFFYAGPERSERIDRAFVGGEPIAAIVARIDAWVTPPAYTSRAPLFLTGETARPDGTVYSVPEGSVVTVRTGGRHGLEVISTSAAGDIPAEIVEPPSQRNDRGAETPNEHQITLSEAATVTVRRGDDAVAAWEFNVEPDAPPVITLAGTPAPTASGALKLTYAIEDDYGVIAAESIFEPIGDATADTEARPLYPAPSFPLSLPHLRARSGSGETIRDLTSHPWAGRDVLMTLVAHDDASQEGRSAPTVVKLPARRFNNPLARAVVEQRGELALDANAAGRVADALDALTFAPEESIDDYGNYIALRTAYFRLLEARDDDGLREIVDYLWSIALGIEDGDLSLTAQALRDAQEALRQALENGASDEEIARLAQELREAMQRFLQALAEEAMRNPQLGNLPPDMDLETLRSQDLDRMLDRIEDLARSGARDAARQLLSELQNMLENLQAGMPMMGDPQAGEMMQGLNELGEMIRRQQQLMDQTHRADRGLDPNGGQSGEMTAEQLEQALRQLQQQQGDLRESLQELMERLEGMGMEPNGKLGQAGESMGDATDALGEGRSGRAVGSQGEALDALRQGAQGMAQQLANRGRGNGPGGIRGGDNFPNEDPLGRPQRTTGPDLGTQVKVPDEIDTQRAREILDAIRRRLSEPTRPLIERDYLERLLDQF
jgi:uncharacterized protein (TIGR02302 family)